MPRAKPVIEVLDTPAEVRAEKERAQHRRYMRNRLKTDPVFAAAHAERSRKWIAEKKARCPEFRMLTKLRTRLCNLRYSLEWHQKWATKQEKALIETAKEVARLYEVCKGK
jgi:hypothetical protein